MLLQMRRRGSLPDSASLNTCFLDGSLSNLPGPYMTFERISQGKINVWNFLKNIYFIKEHTPRKPVRLLVRRPDSSWQLLPNYSWLQEVFWALSVYIPVNGAPTMIPSLVQDTGILWDLRNRDKYSLVLHHS